MDAKGWFWLGCSFGGETMLQANLSCFPTQMAVFDPTFEAFQASDHQVEPATSPCPMTGKLLELFEEITGWKPMFCESNASLHQRSNRSHQSDPFGSFSIIDMSASWPAQRPTSHRGKCDQFIKLFDQLIGDLHTSRRELSKVKSCLVALDPSAEIDDDELVDGFIPKFTATGVASIESEPPRHLQVAEAADADSDFELNQPLSSSAVNQVSPPFDGWALGGSTGIVGNHYLDWSVDQDERILICVGEIDNETGLDQESILQVDPLTKEFQIARCEDGTGFQGLHPFYLWDSNSRILAPIRESSDWRLLEPEQSIVTTTNAAILELNGEGSLQNACRDSSRVESPNQGQGRVCQSIAHLELDSALPSGRLQAEQLADALTQVLDGSDPLLVLQVS